MPTNNVFYSQGGMMRIGHTNTDLSDLPFRDSPIHLIPHGETRLEEVFKVDIHYNVQNDITTRNHWLCWNSCIWVSPKYAEGFAKRYLKFQFSLRCSAPERYC
jgi:hypothetical protein